MRYRVPDLALLIRAAALALAMLLACGCAGAYRWDAAGRAAADPEADRVYEVRRGDTLYSIAWRYGLDYRALAAQNGIGSDFTIYPGQKLNLVGGPADATSAPVNVSPSPSSPSKPPSPVAWRWPAAGPVTAKFGAPNAIGKGINIGGSVGDPIRAAADGKVVYAGSGLIGYGKIIIVKHSEEYLSAYGHNDTIYVREGEEVRQGDRIASM
ncbi:MAG TPA: peptidoglycan DD-metalloendopeptidase family protein, partial [Gammaproteobacteria bacterium]